MTQGAATGTMPPIEHFDRAHRDLLSDKSIQFDPTPFVPPKVPGWLESLIQFLSSPLFKYLFWGVVALAVAAIIALILHRFWGLPLPWKRRGTEQVEPAESWQPEAAPARALLREADMLAQEGRFNEAAHLLLFRSIEDIENRRPKLVRPALTSRDIAAAPEIPSTARSAFGAIVALVERSLFAGRTLSREDWSECRSAYERFAFNEAWR